MYKLLTWLIDVWPFSLIFGIPQVQKPIIPTFVDPNVIMTNGIFYNPDYYASEQTAKEIMIRFNAMGVYEKPIQDRDGLTPPQWFVRFSDGLEVNVGQIAKFFTAYPEKKYPQIAVRYGINLIGMHRAAKMAEEEYKRKQTLGG